LPYLWGEEEEEVVVVEAVAAVVVVATTCEIVEVVVAVVAVVAVVVVATLRQEEGVVEPVLLSVLVPIVAFAEGPMEEAGAGPLLRAVPVYFSWMVDEVLGRGAVHKADTFHASHAFQAYQAYREEGHRVAYRTVGDSNRGGNKASSHWTAEAWDCGGHA